MIDDVKIRSPLNLNESDYRFVVEPRSTLQGTETELRVTANLPALGERGEEAVKMGDPIHWYITTPSGQEIEGEKDTFHESKAGGPSDVATYDFPEAGEYVVRVELPESGLERAWIVNVSPSIQEDSEPELSGKDLAEAKAEEILGSVDRENTTGVQFYEHPTAGSNGYWVVFQDGGYNSGGKNVAVVVESTTGDVEEDETILLPVFYTIEVKQQYLDASQIGATHRANGEELIRLANELKEGKITTSRMKSAFSLIETTTIKIIFGPMDVLTAGATSLVVSAYFDTAFSLMGEGDLSVYESYFYGTGYIERSYGDDIGSLLGRDMSFDTAYSINSIYPTTIVNLNIAEAATLDNEGLAESINGLRDVQKRIANADSLIWGYAAKDMMTSLEKLGF